MDYGLTPEEFQAKCIKMLNEIVTSGILPLAIRKKLFEELLKRGVDINAKIKDGRNALGLIGRNKDGDEYVTSDDIEFAEWLINKGCDMNHKSDRGDTPFLLAIYLQDLRLAHLLLKKGADYNIPNERGLTALHVMRSYLEGDELLEKVETLESQKELDKLANIKDNIDFTIL